MYYFVIISLKNADILKDIMMKKTSIYAEYFYGNRDQ
jgi:hypothetical protein